MSNLHQQFAIYTYENGMSGKIYIGQIIDLVDRDRCYIKNNGMKDNSLIETKAKKSKAMKGKTWKTIDGKRVWFPKENK